VLFPIISNSFTGLPHVYHDMSTYDLLYSREIISIEHHQRHLVVT
jgi:hypothetical protein